MGKKGKGAKKDDKSKTEDVKPVAVSLKAVLEAPVATTKPEIVPTPPRSVSSKKSDRILATRIGCVQRFRWDASKKAPALPVMSHQKLQLNRIYQSLLSTILRPGDAPKQTQQGQLIIMIYGTGCQWRKYLDWRADGDRTLAQEMFDSGTLKDGLSAPVSIACMYATMVSEQGKATGSDFFLEGQQNCKPLHVVVVGATAANEEKILKQTKYWDELGLLLSGRQVHLYLTGVEISGNYTKDSAGGEEGLVMSVECWKGKAVDFFLEKGRLDLFKTEETIVVALNSGIGLAAQQLSAAVNKDFDSNEVIWNWLPSLYFLAAVDLPLMLTCASEDDLKHSMGVLHRVIGMYDVIGAIPGKTPFHSIVGAEGTEDSTVLRANSYFMVAQGQRPNPPRISSLGELPAEDRRKAFRSALHGVVTPPDKHPSMIKSSSMRNRASSANGPPLVPLKRYGKHTTNAPKEDTEGSGDAAPRERAATPSDEGGMGDDATDDVRAAMEELAATASDGGIDESEDPLRVSLRHSFDLASTSEGTENLTAVTVEGVFLTDPATTRVGVRRKSFTLHYHDCLNFRDAVYEADLPEEVDHTTAKVYFLPSTAQVKFTARLLGRI